MTDIDAGPTPCRSSSTRSRSPGVSRSVGGSPRRQARPDRRSKIPSSWPTSSPVRHPGRSSSTRSRKSCSSRSRVLPVWSCLYARTGPRTGRACRPTSDAGANALANLLQHTETSLKLQVTRAASDFTVAGPASKRPSFRPASTPVPTPLPIFFSTLQVPCMKLGRGAAEGPAGFEGEQPARNPSRPVADVPSGGAADILADGAAGRPGEQRADETLRIEPAVLVQPTKLRQTVLLPAHHGLHCQNHLNLRTGCEDILRRCAKPTLLVRTLAKRRRELYGASREAIVMGSVKRARGCWAVKRGGCRDGRRAGCRPRKKPDGYSRQANRMDGEGRGRA